MLRGFAVDEATALQQKYLTDGWTVEDSGTEPPTPRDRHEQPPP